MKDFYCAECGVKLKVFRKALAGYGRIIELVEPHVCLPEPVEFDLTPSEVPMSEPNPEHKFVKKLNNLPKHPVITGPLDRRPKEFIKKEDGSSAPKSLLNMISNIPHVEPAGDPSEEPEDDLS